MPSGLPGAEPAVENGDGVQSHGAQHPPRPRCGVDAPRVVDHDDRIVVEPELACLPSEVSDADHRVREVAVVIGERPVDVEAQAAADGLVRLFARRVTCVEHHDVVEMLSEPCGRDQRTGKFNAHGTTITT